MVFDEQTNRCESNFNKKLCLSGDKLCKWFEYLCNDWHFETVECDVIFFM